MKESEFYIFTKNTDATATNKGFYYQYLMTLKVWLEKKDEEEFEIFCETEDDILELNETYLERNYTQLKCYSTNFSLKSPELIKSLMNFYKLYLQYGSKYIGTYNFTTNAGIKPRAGKSLKKWHTQQKKGRYDSSPYVEEVRKNISDHIHLIGEEEIKKKKNVALINKIKNRISEILSEVASKDFINFLDRVRWDFTDRKDEDFEGIINEIINLLGETSYNKSINVRIVISYLLHHILIKSSEKNINGRILNKKLLVTLLENTQNSSLVLKTLEEKLLPLLNQFLNIDEKISEIQNDTKKILNVLGNNKKSNTNELFLLYENLIKWFKVLDRQIGDIEKIEEKYFYFTLSLKERRKITKVFVYGLTKEIGIKEINLVSSLRKNFECDEGWIISNSYPSPSAIEKTNNNNSGDILVYNFDELLEETIDLTNYFDWIEKEINIRQIKERYIPLAGKKGEYDPITKEIIATNFYLEKQGWLDGYIDSWLGDKNKEHISILGEFGTGKTWFTLYTTWRQINKYKEARNKKTTRPRIPILIPLRDFSKALQVDVLISDFFFRKHEIEIKGVFGAFMLLNEMGKLLLIFDGFDEMAEKVDKQKMIDNFWELASIIKEDSKVILTCRNEHFSTVMEKKALFSSEFKQSTKKITGFFPQFELIELLKFNNTQIKKVLSFITDQKTIDLIFKSEEITDLLSRPIMIELIIDAIKEIEQGKEINLSSIYFYAVRRKMERDISQGRTFTSLTDKIFFMTELAWEMLAKDKLTISFKEFPEIIPQYFQTKVDNIDLDYWRYDMRAQSMLIIDDEGNYKPAHKSLLEFFVAFKLSCELGLLKDEYLQDTNGNPLLNHLPIYDFENVSKSFGMFHLSSNKMTVVKDFLLLLINFDQIKLWEIYDVGLKNKHKNEVLLNNILLLLSHARSNFDSKDISGLTLSNLDFENLDFNSINLSNSTLINTSFRNTNLFDTDFSNAIFQREDHGYISNNSINGHTKVDFDEREEEFVIIERFCLNLHSLITNETSNLYSTERFPFVSDVKFLNADKWILLLEGMKVSIYDRFSFEVILETEGADNYFGGVEIKNNLIAIFNDNFSKLKHLRILNSNDFSKPIEFDNIGNGLFGACFTPKADQIIAGGRDGIVYTIDISTQKVKNKISLKDLEKYVSKELQSHSNYVYSISLTNDSKILAIASTMKCIFLWDFKKNELFRIIDTNKHYTTKVKFSPDNNFLVYTKEYGGVIVLSTKNYEVVYSNDKFDNFRFSKKGKYISFFLNHYESEIEIIEMATLKKAYQKKLTFDYSKLKIAGLKAPLFYIKMFINRGAKDWYTKEDFEKMDNETFDKLCDFLDLPEEKKIINKVKKIEYIFNYIN